MECPICGLLNPDSSQRCDCGFDFHSARVEKSLLDEKEKALRQEVEGRRLRRRFTPMGVLGVCVLYGAYAALRANGWARGVGALLGALVIGLVLAGIAALFQLVLRRNREARLRRFRQEAGRV